mgnify:CR=1 FL=1
MRHPMHFPPPPPPIEHDVESTASEIPPPLPRAVANVLVGWHAGRNNPNRGNYKPTLKVKMAALLVRIGYTDAQ